MKVGEEAGKVLGTCCNFPIIIMTGDLKRLTDYIIYYWNALQVATPKKINNFHSDKRERMERKINHQSNESLLGWLAEARKNRGKEEIWEVESNELWKKV